MNVKKNDTVIVLSGKDKGKKGKVLEAMPAAGKVVVEGVNVATCHVKPKKQGDQGGIINREIPMYASKVMLVCPKCGSRNLTKIERMNGYLSYSRVKGDTRLNDAKMAEIAERKSM
ncbi:MAG: 50S ribosomal protein L24 [Firmicutes bacterium]|nr:50S ribosomal protein L24 [Bacillota bacterium]